jgi:hypothetical protein
MEMLNRLLILSLSAFALSGALGAYALSAARSIAPAPTSSYTPELPARPVEFAFRTIRPPGEAGRHAQTGGELDPPPEDDPNVMFTVPVRAGVLPLDPH